MIKDGKKRPLSHGAGSMPNVSGALTNWYTPLSFWKVAKSVVNYETVESLTLIKFRGVMQPFSMEQLLIKPEGQRSWKWWMVHTDTDLELKNDDVIEYGDSRYRVKEKGDYSLNGYYEYHIVEDFEA